MVRYRVPERVGTQPEPRKQLHVTAGYAVGTATFGAAIVTLWTAVSGLVHIVPALGATAALIALTAWAFAPLRGVPPLYQHAPQAPVEARARGHLATAVVDRQTAVNKTLTAGTDVTWRLLVAAPEGRRYRTTTMARFPGGVAPTHRAGTVVAVRVHPEQRGVVVVVDDEPPGPPPARPSRPVPEYSGAPQPTRGIVVPELRAALLLLGPLLVGVLAPIVILSLIQVQ